MEFDCARMLKNGPNDHQMVRTSFFYSTADWNDCPISKDACVKEIYDVVDRLWRINVSNGAHSLNLRHAPIEAYERLIDHISNWDRQMDSLIDVGCTENHAVLKLIDGLNGFEFTPTVVDQLLQEYNSDGSKPLLQTDLENLAIEYVKKNIQQVVTILGLGESNWKSDMWKTIWPLITQYVLNDAYQQHLPIRKLFPEVVINSRSCKLVARVLEKMKEQSPGRENNFKVVGDFVAGRIHCQLSEIQAKIDYLRKIVEGINGIIFIRGSSEQRPYGWFKNGDKYTDITQYVYIYLEQIGYPFEVQIGHKFAAHTFTIDSAIRDAKNHGQDVSQYVDLWTKDFYADVKKYLLEQANGQVPSISKEQIQAKAKEIHPNGIPAELQEILGEIKPEVKPEVKAEVKAEVKPEVNPVEVKPVEVKAEVKTVEVKSEVKSEPVSRDEWVRRYTVILNYLQEQPDQEFAKHFKSMYESTLAFFCKHCNMGYCAVEVAIWNKTYGRALIHAWNNTINIPHKNGDDRSWMRKCPLVIQGAIYDMHDEVHENEEESIEEP